MHILRKIQYRAHRGVGLIQSKIPFYRHYAFQLKITVIYIKVFNPKTRRKPLAWEGIQNFEILRYKTEVILKVFRSK